MSEKSEGLERYVVPGLERGLKLLLEFNRHNAALTAPELAKRMELPRTTVFRLLATLEIMGFVTRHGNEYKLGMSVLRLGFEYLASLELTELGQPVLNRLSQEIGYSCNLVVRDERSIVYVAKVTPPGILASTVTVGTRLPAHATVLGRILLEDLSLSELRELYPENQLEGYSSNTPQTVESLHDMVQQDLKRGYALSEGFYESSISTIAAPVRDGTGKIVAALGATIPSSHIDDEQLSPMVSKVRTSAEELSRLLGYTRARGY
ncbi:IclR family transcriptional regulator [Oceanobacter mangrovi]|uniref:IclR family transcriptional regulator n=1 Tax=Oceanobacter mangrovi TaxID=2862510 RepID=UPI001C8DBD4E|nr:IclR family transcriptional regulator [Oceanobacter mangrovi]